MPDKIIGPEPVPAELLDRHVNISLRSGPPVSGTVARYVDLGDITFLRLTFPSRTRRVRIRMRSFW